MNDRSAGAQMMEAHLKMLYSAKSASGLEHQAASHPLSALRSTVDFLRLGVEQKGRVRGLWRHCLRQAPEFFKRLGDEQALALMTRFADAPAFWEAKGRSLLENFCYFVAPLLAPTEPGVAEWARLVGIASGLPSKPTHASPWANPAPVSAEIAALPRFLVAEAFSASHALLDETGAVALGAKLVTPVTVFVAVFDDLSLLVGSSS